MGLTTWRPKMSKNLEKGKNHSRHLFILEHPHCMEKTHFKRCREVLQELAKLLPGGINIAMPFCQSERTTCFTANQVDEVLSRAEDHSVLDLHNPGHGLKLWPLKQGKQIDSSNDSYRHILLRKKTQKQTPGDDKGPKVTTQNENLNHKDADLEDRDCSPRPSNDDSISEVSFQYRRILTNLGCANLEDDEASSIGSSSDISDDSSDISGDQSYGGESPSSKVGGGDTQGKSIESDTVSDKSEEVEPLRQGEAQSSRLHALSALQSDQFLARALPHESPVGRLLRKNAEQHLRSAQSGRLRIVILSDNIDITNLFFSLSWLRRFMGDRKDLAKLRIMIRRLGDPSSPIAVKLKSLCKAVHFPFLAEEKIRWQDLSEEIRQDDMNPPQPVRWSGPLLPKLLYPDGEGIVAHFGAYVDDISPDYTDALIPLFESYVYYCMRHHQNVFNVHFKW